MTLLYTGRLHSYKISMISISHREMSENKTRPKLLSVRNTYSTE